MQLQKNAFRAALAKHGVSRGIWCGIPDPSAGEILAATGLDWLLVDGEHAPFDLAAIRTYLQAVAPYDVAVLVRPPEGSDVVIKQLLDLGVETLLVPMVETAAEAERLVAATRYPPAGIRGVGTALARASRWNAIDGYLDGADDEICLIVQVESVHGLANLEAIAAVDGVDGVFIGPADLAASMGHLGHTGHPEVVAAIESALAAIARAGSHAGVLALDPVIAERYVAAGAHFVGVGVDTLLLRDAARRLARARP